MTMPNIGRNEPCPCGSGKKYKRCCGTSAEPKLGMPKSGFQPPAGFDPSQMDPQAMAKVAQALQRLPRAQMQRLQSLMQRAMAGKDVSKEAEELERTLPPDVKEMLGALMPQGAAPAAASEGMTEEQAKQIVEQAVAEGRLSADEAKKLLSKESK